ncbi:junctional adhesion molecule A-like isoform X1 [Gopherus flavomarginatus]|uniref:junctional adhesion molecule A-like isoform X1 n=2 Tax=Gopherus flavomarginatus TaxID=286002 RepID=UPI0021CBE8E1|nr:junctional adhesion molecule A-like isoform X1 [Gopherus flavomarginatus]
MGRLPAPSIIYFIVFIVPSIAAGLGVQQLPPMARVPARGSITLSCTFHSHNRTRTQVTWARGSWEAVVLDPAHPFYQGRLAQSQRDQQGRAEATVTLSELMERDSDLYHCYITYPQGEQAKGTGTTLTVLGRAVAEIPAGCKRALVPNLRASGQKPAGLRISQEPRSLRATAGENVTLSCTFQNRNGSRAKIIWLRGSGEDLELDSNHPFYRGRLHVSRMDEHRQGKATLTLAELQERDSGLYQCCIELDRGETGMGGGTELRVMGRHQSATGGRELCRDSGPLFYRAVISLALVVLFSLGIVLSLRPWKGVPVDPMVGAGSKVPPAPGQVSLI